MTTETNKIIAEFLGWTKIIDREGEITPFYNLPIKFRNPNGIKEYIPIKGFVFESDWNWLMEVVEKIEGLEFYPKNSTCIGFDSFGIEINKNRCDITRYGDFTHLLLQGQGKTRIESVYNACLEFIKWYNQQKK